MIERDGDGAAPVIELTNGMRITCTQSATMSATGAERAAASAHFRVSPRARRHSLFIAAEIGVIPLIGI